MSPTIYKPGPLDDDFALGQTTRVLIAAAYQIIATVRGPMETIQDYAPAMYLSSWLGVAVETNIPDIVKDSGSQVSCDIYWKDLKPDSVVGVGGSVGSVTHLLVKAFPDLKYIVHDLPKAIGQTDEYWQAQYPDEASNPVKTGRPISNASVYMMHFVLHDWPALKCHTILNHLRAAASKTTKLILFEAIVPYACPHQMALFRERWKLVRVGKAPWPLLSNSGLGVGGFHTMFDKQMVTMFNGQERTLPEFIELRRKSSSLLTSM
ncbi:O-methyltransferase-domain-containing protein, partial [Rhodocollybia butyracea]